MPAKDELNVMYTNRAAIGNFNASDFWTSSESGNATGWYQNFSSGSQSSGGKDVDVYLRCARSE